MSKWISVKDRLPPINKYVLVRFKNNDMAVVCRFSADEDIDEGWESDCDFAPTHWMPLPEPPKEDT